jgi:hypothetical protein
MVLRKVVAFIGLLGVIYALALQHGLFDRADAATTLVPQVRAPAQPVAKAEAKAATQKSHPRH